MSHVTNTLSRAHQSFAGEVVKQCILNNSFKIIFIVRIINIHFYPLTYSMGKNGMGSDLVNEVTSLCTSPKSLSLTKAQN
jgi:hypothetical protein